MWLETFSQRTKRARPGVLVVAPPDYSLPLRTYAPVVRECDKILARVMASSAAEVKDLRDQARRQLGL